MEVKIEKSWKDKLQDEFDKDYFKNLAEFIRQEYQRTVVYPHPKNIFKAFDLCPFDKVKVVILGQDPYHGPRQYHGLVFSVYEDIPNPPSLVNLFKELKDDLGQERTNSNLSSWAEQGVLLLNVILTVQAGKAGSHQGKGWEKFTDSVIKLLSDQKEHIVFLLWGAYAQSKEVLIDESKHLILKAPHPSPLSAFRGFFGCKHFSKTNEYLKKHGIEEIDWFK